jgi:rhamnose transport system ATP-binding protein
MITVMRDGEYVSTDAIKDVTEDEIVRRMVGRDVKELFPKQKAEIGDVVLEVTGLNSTGVFEDVSFTVRSGEIVGLAGLVGAGRSEIARAVFGVDDYQSGTVTLAGRTLPKHNPAASMNAGLALVPEDRRKQGLVLESSIAHNLTLAIRNSLTKVGLLHTSAENTAAAIWASRLQVKANALDSGGNQQKVVLGKWLATNPKVLIIDEPTRGIDVGTKAEVHRLLSELAGQGMGILMISSELPEVLGMADRVLVVREGRITSNIDRSKATAENVMYAATHAEGLAS